MSNMTNSTALRKKVGTLYRIEADKLSAVQNIFTKDQLQLLHQATPEKHIHTFPKNAGSMAGLKFVTGGYMKHMLDRLTGGLWSFEIKEKGTASGQVWVLGRLNLYKNDGSQLIFKEQFGRASIKCKKGTDEPLDIGNDMKAAATDALKKCASELGIARDIYAANEFIEAEIVDRTNIEDMELDETPKPEEKQKKVDDAYKQYVENLLNTQFNKTFDRMKFIQNVTGKMDLKKLSDFDWQFLGDELEQLQLSQTGH
jgi:hypothetical protein